MKKSKQKQTTAQWSDTKANPLEDIKQLVKDLNDQDKFLLQYNRGIEQLKRAETIVKNYYPENKQDAWGQQNPDLREVIKEWCQQTQKPHQLTPDTILVIKRPN